MAQVGCFQGALKFQFILRNIIASRSSSCAFHARRKKNCQRFLQLFYAPTLRLVTNNIKATIIKRKREAMVRLLTWIHATHSCRAGWGWSSGPCPCHNIYSHRELRRRSWLLIPFENLLWRSPMMLDSLRNSCPIHFFPKTFFLLLLLQFNWHSWLHYKVVN